MRKIMPAKEMIETVSFAAYPSDLDHTIPYCMEQYLNGQEQDILRRIYWNNETYESISTVYNTNSSNIKKINSPNACTGRFFTKGNIISKTVIS